jgi:hypothetical protein
MMLEPHLLLVDVEARARTEPHSLLIDVGLSKNFAAPL